MARQAGSAKVIIMSKELSITDLGWQRKGLPWRYRLKLNRREQPVMVQSINVKGRSAGSGSGLSGGCWSELLGAPRRLQGILLGAAGKLQGN